MPHLIVKIYSGRSDAEKTKLEQEILVGLLVGPLPVGAFNLLHGRKSFSDQYFVAHKYTKYGLI
jgi:hypothetical protein